MVVVLPIDNGNVHTTHTNKVTVHWAWLVLRWMTIRESKALVTRLLLSVQLDMGTGQNAVMHCGLEERNNDDDG